MEFGILGPRPRQLQRWQYQALTRLIEAGGRLVAWRDAPASAPRRSGGQWSEVVDGSRLEPKGHPAAPAIWLDLDVAGPGAPREVPGERWGFRGSPWRSYAGPGAIQEVELVGGGRRLQRARVRLSPALAASVETWFEVASELPARALRQLREMGRSSFSPAEERVPEPEPTSGALLGRSLARRIQDVGEDLFVYDTWNVGVASYRVRAPGDLTRLGEIRWLPPLPVFRSIADPFPLGADEFLVEDYSHGRRAKGRLARVGAEGRPEVEIEEPFHLSYPSLVTDGGELYCVPESYQARECRLYRKVGDAWVFEQTLLDGGEFLDPTIFRHEGRWWLLCGDREAGGNARLLAFHAPELRGPWEPHGLNPLRWDVVGARPAGPAFRCGDDLYRPGQDCQHTYGGAVVVHHVQALTPTTFLEVPVARVEPCAGGPYPDGLHHLVVEPGRVIVDGKRTRVGPFFWLRRLLRTG